MTPQPRTIREQKAAIVAACDRLMPEAVLLARQVFDLREVSGQERESARLLADRLRFSGASVELGIGGLPTAFRASFPPPQAGGNADDPCVALLAEYDALEGLGHACGHHVSGTASAFAAIALQECRVPNGSLWVIGTPMEEQGGGKIVLVERGIFRELDAVLMTHTSNETRAAYRTSAAQGYRITLSGGPSIREWRARTIMDVLSDVLVGIRAVEQRAGVGTQILWVIPEGGKQNNVIPDRVVVDFSVWCYDEDVLQRNVDRIRSRVQQATVNTTVTAAVVANEPLYLPLEPSEPLVTAFERNLTVLNVPFEPHRGHLFDATDIGNVSHVVPTLHADVFLAKLHDHTPEYAAAGSGPEGERYLGIAMKALALTAFDLLRDTDDLARAKRELAERHQPKELRSDRLPK